MFDQTNSPLDKQVGGDHYKKMKIQPMEYIVANDIGFAEGTAIAYLSRWKSKGGIEDLKKARHTIELLIELEEGKVEDVVMQGNFAWGVDPGAAEGDRTSLGLHPHGPEALSHQDFSLEQWSKYLRSLGFIVVHG
ncbi:SaV-like [uncultured Caudovirales phage]|uniref:SaV-like n=1 Tax=uncultured Caudovirales phage TaxID=2100421 RepID=A0A6J5RUU9_9CAUD|nr:SaV-like [uncultured Caudovirales phage]CAB4197956.1 SaV-like [uncultured Caudovirales phage]CAB4211446.1 SaV-like [uncultured Caudovirales phage]CAB5227493.1 SaV-like [uncultured Caudovirales phage]